MLVTASKSQEALGSTAKHRGLDGVLVAGGKATSSSHPRHIEAHGPCAGYAETVRSPLYASCTGLRALVCAYADRSVLPGYRQLRSYAFGDVFGLR